MEKQTEMRKKESREMEHLLLKGEPDVQWNKKDGKHDENHKKAVNMRTGMNGGQSQLAILGVHFKSGEENHFADSLYGYNIFCEWLVKSQNGKTG